MQQLELFLLFVFVLFELLIDALLRQGIDLVFELSLLFGLLSSSLVPMQDKVPMQGQVQMSPQMRVQDKVQVHARERARMPVV
jgi:hypothetical protein